MMTPDHSPHQEKVPGLPAIALLALTALAPGETGTGGSASPPPRAFFLGTKALAILACTVIVLVAFLVAVSGMAPPAGTTALSSLACGEKTLQYINANLVSPGTTATLAGVRENRSVYMVTISYSSQKTTVYATKDCNLLFTNAIDMSAPVSPASSQQEVNKSARPVVDLYAMSYCPYGTQTETAMKPVVDLLGTDADFRVRYITSVTGTTPASVQSLHGAAEVQEDLRQVCINQLYPKQFWNYLQHFDDQCYPVAGNSAALAACVRNVTATLGMDSPSIAACAAGNETVSILAADETAAVAAGAYGSPTIIINGVTYSGARNPEAYKEAICNSFTTPPAACSTALASASNTNPAAGSCS
ncbi:MAG: DsbA family protein [Methanoregula sp.]|nr:DsbA family protein [Methanoregula sp.]